MRLTYGSGGMFIIDRHGISCRAIKLRRLRTSSNRYWGSCIASTAKSKSRTATSAGCEAERHPGSLRESSSIDCPSPVGMLRSREVSPKPRRAAWRARCRRRWRFRCESSPNQEVREPSTSPGRSDPNRRLGRRGSKGVIPGCFPIERAYNPLPVRGLAAG